MGGWIDDRLRNRRTEIRICKPFVYRQSPAGMVFIRYAYQDIDIMSVVKVFGKFRQQLGVQVQAFSANVVGVALSAIYPPGEETYLHGPGISVVGKHIGTKDPPQFEKIRHFKFPGDVPKDIVILMMPKSSLFQYPQGIEFL